MKRLTYLEQNGGKWEEYKMPVLEEDYEATIALLEGRGERVKLHTGYDPETGEEIEVLPVDVEPEPTDAELLEDALHSVGVLEQALCLLLGVGPEPEQEPEPEQAPGPEPEAE